MAKITHIFSYNPNSEGAILLSQEMNLKRIRHEKSRYKGNPKKLVINWGSSNLPEEVGKSKIINEPKAVGVCTNKLNFFRALKGSENIPPWTDDQKVAMKWVTEGSTVCARQVLQGHSAEGLVIMKLDDPSSYVKAPLYTKYIPKAEEFRVHIVNGAITDVQRKALRSTWREENEGKTPNFHVRNLANGFVYVRGGFTAPDVVLGCAVSVMKEIGLDFGAVDVIYNQRYNKGYALEINTAPGIEGTSVKNYAAAFTDMFK